MKRLLAIAGAVLALILVAALALPFVIDPNRFRPILETRLTEALGREVKLGDLKLAILHGSVKASDLSIADDPAYSTAPFVKAKSLAIGVEVWPLIVSRKLHVTGLVIGEPEIALIQSTAGEWNFSSLGRKAKEQPAKAAAAERPSGNDERSRSLGDYSSGSKAGNFRSASPARARVRSRWATSTSK